MSKVKHQRTKKEEKGLIWREENRNAIEEYNRRVAANGVFRSAWGRSYLFF